MIASQPPPLHPRRHTPGAIMLAVLATICAAAVLATLGAAAASAAVKGAGWSIRSVASPTNFTSGVPGSGYFLTATNVGTADSTGRVTITDTLPEGVMVTGIPQKGARAYEPNNEDGEGENVPCALSGNPARTVTCAYSGPVQPGGVITVHIEAEAVHGIEAIPPNQAQVREEGAANPNPVTGDEPTSTPVSPTPAAFGVQQFSIGAFGPAGEPLTQAGAHPATISTAIAYNTVLDQQKLVNNLPWDAVAEPKVENVDLPMGFLGDPLSAPRCSAAALASESCPPDTRVGVVGIYKAEGYNDDLLNLYNVTPETGYPAQFGFAFLKTVIMLRARLLPTEHGYVLSVPVPAVPRSENVKSHEVSVLFFGFPGAADGAGAGGEAFATLPSSCASGPLDATLEMDSWEDPGDWQGAAAPMFAANDAEGVTGCSGLSFAPSIDVTPETTVADSPSGYEVLVRVPQAPNIEGVRASSELKNAVVSFPAGVSLSPSAANGLVACPETGPEGIDLARHDQLDADRLAEEGTLQEGEEFGFQGNEDGLVHAAPGHCPAASQVGAVEVKTPLLEEPLKGHLYVAEPGCGGAGQGPCTNASAEDGELFGVFLEVAGSGLVVKLHGEVSVNPQTGALTTRFVEAPELPFSELRLNLNGGQRAPLATPQSCATFTATSLLTPWSTPFTPDAAPSSQFQISSGCAGTFAPGFAAGMQSTLHAGAFAPFTLQITRQDSEQDLSGLTVNMPEGLVGRIAGIPQCPEAAANAGTCAQAAPGSRVGTATAAAGPGADPYWQSGGVYLTGPYDGAPFGLSVVVPAVAGPYDLGNIVVRAAIHINPLTAAVSVVSGPLPQMVDGVPLRIKTINVTVGGEGTPFTFNPTGCTAKTITATIKGAQGASAPVSAPFAASGCNTLPFKPTFTVSTQGAASRSNGASLDVKITTHQGPEQKPGEEEANIRKVDVQLPIDLPSRLTTLQKACTEQQYAKDAAGCPEASFVGTAVAHTPLLPVPLEGPAILVSHAGASFPDLDLVLQGDGVVIDLTGNTLIEHGITYSKFETAPDAPISSFELKLPKGPHSILGAYVPTGGYSFCNLKKYVTVTSKVKGKTKKTKKAVAATLEMPTTITGQNGAVVKQTTKIAVAGCATAQKASAAKHARRSSRR